MINKNKFPLSEFKKWVKNHNDENEVEQKNHLVGIKVESKISEKRLIDKIITKDESKLEELAKLFHEGGGIVKEVEENNLLIEVKVGEFTINKMYIKKHRV